MDSDQEITYRHKIGIDTLSLLDSDPSTDNTEEIALSNIDYMLIIKSFSTEREKFIALALDIGFKKIDIAFMLNASQSQVTRDLQKMKLKLRK